MKEVKAAELFQQLADQHAITQHTMGIGYEVTLICRDLSGVNHDLLLTNDDFDKVIAVLNRAKDFGHVTMTGAIKE